MNLSEMKINEYIDLLASNAPAPGGGSASALSGSQGVALTSMVCNLTIGKEKYKENEELVKEVQKKCMILKNEFLRAMDEDTETFKVMEDAFKMPKNTDGQKEARREAMQHAMKVCCAVPVKIMELAQEGLALTDSIIGKSNESALSDLAVAALNLKSCICGAWFNVLINISGIKDEVFVNEHRALEDKLLRPGVSLADKIYSTIDNSLKKDSI